MTEQENKDQSAPQAGNNSIAIGKIEVGGDVSGAITIGNTGYTAEEVSVLITQITATFQPKPFDGRCPYKGLDVFEEEDAELFFGREKLVNDLVNRAKDSRTVFVTGPSGSGKSSLVRAGLIHALKQGVIKGSERWLYATMKPGRDPIESLANAFSRLKSPELGNYFRQHVDQVKVLHECAESTLTDNKNQWLVLFIDQFEEVFTQISKEEERVTFLNLLTHAATIENRRVIILFSMRSDFVSNCATYPQLNALLNQQFVQIGAMQPEELVSAIAQPALRVGLRIDPDLIAQIINEMKGEPGALPLMQFALKDLFDSQQEKSGVIALTLNDYLQRGGIHKALERHADDSFSKLSKNEQELARSIFSGLIEIGRGTQDTRRTALFDELVPANAKAVDIEAIVQKLADARLITTDEQAGKDTITISHEKLIEAWPWLKKLVNDNRDVIALQNEIAADAKEWEDQKRDGSYLYRGARLINARDQLGAKKLILSELAQKFVQAGQARQKRGQFALIVGISAVMGLLVLAVFVFRGQSSANAQLAQQKDEIAKTAQAASTLAVEQRDEAQQQERIARSRELASYASLLINDQLDLSMLLGVESLRSAETYQAKSVLLTAYQTSLYLDQFLFRSSSQFPSLTERVNYYQGPPGSSSNVGFSPDGSILASATEGEIILWNINTRKPISRFTAHQALLITLAYSQNGNVIASSCDGSDSSLGCWTDEVILWDVTDPASPKQLGSPLINKNPERFGVMKLVFSPDGNTLAVIGKDENFFELWNLSTRQVSIASLGSEHKGTVTDLAFNSDGNTIFLGSCAKFEDSTGSCIQGELILWDVESNQPIGIPMAGHTDYVRGLAISPDGSMLASGSCASKLGDVCIKGEILLWDIQSRQSIPTIVKMQEHSDAISNLIYSRDGKILISGSRDRSIILWDVEPKTFLGKSPSGNPNLHVSESPTRPEGAAHMSPNNIFGLWTFLGDQFVYRRFALQSGEVGLSPNTGDGGLEHGFDSTKIGKIPLTMYYQQSQIPGTIISKSTSGYSLDLKSIALNPNGNTLALGHRDGTVILWDLAKPLAAIKHPIGKGTGPMLNKSTAFSHDSRTLFVVTSDNEITLWDVATRDLITPSLRDASTKITSIALSPDDKILASGGLNGTITLWDTTSREPIYQFPRRHSGEVRNLTFSPDGKIVASTVENVIIFWDIDTRRLIGEINDWTFDLAFSPDGKTVAASNNDYITLWNTQNLEPIGILQAWGFGTEYFAFSPDGKFLASNSSKDIVLWDLAAPDLGQLLSKHGWEISDLTFSPDGKILASASQDYMIVLWDFETRQVIGNPIYTYSDWAHNLLFSPDGKFLVSDFAYSPAVIWDMDMQVWTEQACKMAGRNFTRAEWAQYFPNEEYRATCPQWPLEPEATATPTGTP